VIGGGWRPTFDQERLLVLALEPRADLADAWRQWRTAHPERDLASLDGGTARLLPLLHAQLGRLPQDDPATAVIRGYFRRSLYHGQLLRARAASVMARFAQVGMPMLVMKGGVLGPVYYDHPAMRPMNDFDVLVPRERAVDAVRILLGAGWRSTLPLPELLPEAYHSACFQSPDGIDFDLHWHLLPEACEHGADDAAWTGSEPFAVNGVACRQLCATDLLVVVCAHAAHWMPTSPVRWIADATMILRRAGRRIDWERVAMLAERWHVQLHLRDTLGYLADRWAAPVPARVLQELEAAPGSSIDRRAFRMLGKVPGTLAYLARPWLRYRLRTRELRTLAALPGFVRYLEITLGRDSAHKLPKEIAERFLRWRADRARGLR
jgi:hypothetical protein